MEKVYDVFISYRRDRDQELARTLQLGLENHGLRVFFDLEVLRGGNFSEMLYTAIEQSKNVIFLLTDDVCDFFADKDDQCRLELEHALQHRINIVPVAPLGSPRSFPEKLPETLKPIRELNVAPLDKNDLFKKTVHEIVTNYLFDIDSIMDTEAKEAEKVFLELVRTCKKNDDFIDLQERIDLEAKAKELKICAVRRESIIQQVEKEFQKSNLLLSQFKTEALTASSSYDVFISYRRDGGSAYARLMYDRLTQAGYSVSFDMDTLKNGNFNEELLKRVVICKNFVILLSKDCFQRTLDGCKREEDWMRIELATALAHKRNVITVMLPGFVFPESLPADIDAVRFKNGPKYDDYYIDNFYSKLMSDFLQGGKNQQEQAENINDRTLLEDTFFLVENKERDDFIEEILHNDAAYCRQEAESIYKKIPRVISYVDLVKIDNAWMEAEENFQRGDNKTASQRYLDVISYSAKIKISNNPFVTRLVADGIDTNSITWFEAALVKAYAGNADYQYGVGSFYLQGIGIEKNASKAFRWFERAAAQNHLNAITAVGTAYALGDGVEKNYSLAFKYLEQAIKNDDDVAYERLGYLYLQGGGIEKKDYLSAAKFFRRSAELGNTDAMFALGKMLEMGIMGTVDLKSAIDWYQLAAEKGNATAQTKMAQLQLHGKGIETNVSQAIKYARLAALHGNADAVALLGKAYEEGLGVDVNKEQAVDLYHKALTSGSKLAENYLSEMKPEIQYKKGMECLESQLGQERDYVQARIWFKKAAKQDNAAAMEHLGFLFEHGLGGDFDISIAVDWYKKAAEKDNIPALANLAHIYLQGDSSIKRDYDQALALAKKAASKWHLVEKESQWKVSYAFYTIGKIYDEGLGVEKDLRMALRFFLTGAHYGNLRCAYRLGNLYRINPDVIPKSLENSKRWYAFCAQQMKNIHFEDAWAMRIIGNLYYLGQGGLNEDEETACLWYEKAAKLGNVSALHNIGMAYYGGFGVPKDSNNAITYFTAGALRGHAESQYWLAKIYSKGAEGIDKDYRKAYEWAIKAAEAGDEEAMELVFQLYRDGLGVDKNEKEALRWLKCAADKNSGSALAVLGNCYEYGNFDIESDSIQAFSLYQKSANCKSLRGYCELGRCYLNGIGTTKNAAAALHFLVLASKKKEERALHLLEEMYFGTENFVEQCRLFEKIDKNENNSALFALGNYFLHNTTFFERGIKCLTVAAEAGHSGSQNNLGWAYYIGRCVQRDTFKAYEWTMKAVQNGSIAGMETLFRMYRDGEGVKQNNVEALNWLKKAVEASAEKNDSGSLATSELGECYEGGLLGIERNESEALALYKTAARKNGCAGKFNLGRCLLYGIGTTENIPAAVHWLKKAAAQKDINDHIYQQRAMLLLADIYRTGKCGEVDEKRAAAWAEKAGELKIKFINSN